MLDLWIIYFQDSKLIRSSIFKDNTVHKTAKSQLAKALSNDVQPCEQNVQATHIIDGGRLIHKVKWPRKIIYRDIVQRYVSYICMYKVWRKLHRF